VLQTLITNNHDGEISREHAKSSIFKISNISKHVKWSAWINYFYFISDQAAWSILLGNEIINEEINNNAYYNDYKVRNK
jgi:hypothetical protein